MVSGGLVGGLIGARVAQSESVRFNTRLPIPPLIDAAKQGGAVKLKVTSGRHAFLKGKPTRSYGYSGPVLGPVVRMRRYTGTGSWCLDMLTAGRIRSSSQAVRGARDSRLSSQHQPHGFIHICTMTVPGRFIWVSLD
jgi:hypothetical protein